MYSVANVTPINTLTTANNSWMHTSLPLWMLIYMELSLLILVEFYEVKPVL